MKMEFYKGITPEETEAYFSEMTEMIFNQIPVPITFVDANCRIVALNNAFLDYLGLKFEDVKGKYVGEIDPNARLPVVIETGKAEIGSRHKLKGRKEVIVNRIPLFYNKKKIGGISIIIIDDLNYVYDLISENNLIRNLKLHKNTKVSDVYKAKYTFEDILSISSAGNKCKQQAEIFAATDFTILITGDSGVGKELFAHAIHNKSKRKNKSFIRVNCAAIPENLMESEFFGYDQGAFTGACKNGKIGKFELANGGTIFLDEIADLPLKMQAKLLRVLQENEIERVGSNNIINIDVRVIAATNCDLLKKVHNEGFRSDLYYRLNVLNLDIPALKKRREDIPLIIKYIIDCFFNKYGIYKKFPENVMEILSLYDWPGNVRELKNIVERMIVVSNDEEVSVYSIPEHILVSYKNNENKESGEENKGGCLKDSILKIENKIIIDTLIENNFNKSKTAKVLDIPRMTLYRKLKEIYSNKEK